MTGATRHGAKDRSPFCHSKTPASKPRLGPNLLIVTSTGLGLWPEPARCSHFLNPPALLKASPEHLPLIEFAFVEVSSGPSSRSGAGR